MASSLWQIKTHSVDLGIHSPGLIMGILNATPDSFSDGGQFSSVPQAVEHALAMERGGADIIDIGGESTRPGSDGVSVADEIERVIPVVELLRSKSEVLISVDTTKAEVARLAIYHGADIVNDVSAAQADPDMLAVLKDSSVGIVIMHMRGVPKTMQQSPEYGDAVATVRGFLQDRVEDLEANGIDPSRIIVDPGIGFGKTAQHNLQLIRRLDELCELRPVCLGTSRKSFLGELTGKPVAQRTAATISSNLFGWVNGARVFRVHDVAPCHDALRVYHAIDASE